MATHARDASIHSAACWETRSRARACSRDHKSGSDIAGDPSLVVGGTPVSTDDTGVGNEFIDSIADPTGDNHGGVLRLDHRYRASAQLFASVVIVDQLNESVRHRRNVQVWNDSATTSADECWSPAAIGETHRRHPKAAGFENNERVRILARSKDEDVDALQDLNHLLRNWQEAYDAV